MKRRDFLKYSSGAVALPTLLGGLPMQAFGMVNSPLMQLLAPGTTDTDHVLVLIFLNGGNDGLNTLIPLDQYGTLANVRPHVIMPQNSLLPLNGQQDVALHPSMSGMQQLFNDGKMHIVQGVGYPDQSYSHFRSTDIWMSASDSDQVIPSGWMGRYLNYEFPNYPTGYPNVDMPDPLAIEIGYSPSLTCQGPQFGMSMPITDPTGFYNIVNGVQTPAPNTPAGDQLSYVRIIADQSRQFGTAVVGAYNNVNTQLAYPTNNSLADQLKICARLIAGGLKTRVYVVGMGGFDTHDDQVEAADHTTGTHALLLQQLSDAILAFQNDLAFLGVDDRVLGMTFSEFGRRIISNASLGTDHGAASPLFVFGTSLNPGVLGQNPVIPVNPTVDDNLPMQYDFRSVYASILKDWFCVPELDLNTIMLQNFQQLPIVNSPSCISSLHEVNALAGRLLVSAYPNPFVEIVNIDYESEGGYTLVQVFDVYGRVVAQLVSGIKTPGKYSVYWNSEDLPRGTYYVRLQNGALQQVKAISKV